MLYCHNSISVLVSKGWQFDIDLSLLYLFVFEDYLEAEVSVETQILNRYLMANHLSLH